VYHLIEKYTIGNNIIRYKKQNGIIGQDAVPRLLKKLIAPIDKHPNARV